MVGQVVGALRSATVVPVLIWLPVQVPPDVIVVDFDPVAPALATATSASSTMMLPGDELDTVPRSAIPIGAVHATPTTWWSSPTRSEEHTYEIQSLTNLVCRLHPEKKEARRMQLR